MGRTSLTLCALAFLLWAAMQFPAGAGGPVGAQGPRELHKVSAGDVTAHFGGVREESSRDMPLEFGVTQLWFTFRNDRKHYVFRPLGELFFSDWRFDVFSPDGNRVLLLQDRFGPYHVVSVDRLRKYLRGEVEPDHVLTGNAPNSSKAEGVHHEGRWTSNDTVEFKLTCCGQTLVKQLPVGPPPR